jgi:glycine cleavage system H protein
LKYTKDHEWVNFDSSSKIGTVGITDYAQQQLGDIVHLSMPKVSEKFNQKDVMATIESVKVVSDIYSPVSGTVTEVNTSIEKGPEVINQDAESQGWLFKMKLDNENELKALLDKAAYDKFVKENSH